MKPVEGIKPSECLDKAAQEKIEAQRAKVINSIKSMLIDLDSAKERKARAEKEIADFSERIEKIKADNWAAIEEKEYSSLCVTTGNAINLGGYTVSYGNA
jgi:predicted  nucleic acid-binding Zn-ribbon protein